MSLIATPPQCAYALRSDELASTVVSQVYFLTKDMSRVLLTFLQKSIREGGCIWDVGRTLLRTVADLLRPGGLMVARFPNGQNPLGRAYQHGDHTPRAILSASIVAQLVRGTRLELIASRKPHRPRLGGPVRRLMIGVKHKLQDLVERAAARGL